MIVVRSPLRITLGGGGTDLPVWYKKNNSFLVFLAINKYIFVTINERNYDNKIWLSYSKIESVDNISDIQNEYIKVCLNRFRKVKSLEFHSISEIPSSSGLGSSGSFLVASNYALNQYYKIKMSKNNLAELSCNQEMYDLNKSTGKQDQFAAAYGGFKKMKINTQGKVNLSNVKISNREIKNFKNNILLYYTNIFRSANNVLKSQSKNISSKNYISNYMKEIQKLGYMSYEAIINKDYDEFGKILDIHYNYKRKISKMMSNSVLDNLYEFGINAGALGGKTIGAGGGGVFMFYVPYKFQKKFRKKIAETGMREISWDIDKVGVTKVFG